MALVHESIGDFLLFPREQTYCNPLLSAFDENPVGLDSSNRSAFAMQQSVPDRRNALFQTSASMPGHPLEHSNNIHGAHFVLDAHNEPLRSYQKRYTPSGSVSPSLPQSLDHPPSTLSSVSGASGQSTASSAVGSPYSLVAHNLPNHDTWNDLHQGLGMAPDIMQGDGFTQDAFPNAGLDNDFCYQDRKLPDTYVGESTKVFSVSFLSSA